MTRRPRISIAFLLGFLLGQWCNGPKACERGYAAGTWTRQVLGLPPIEPMP
jgi:hypothetical protein